MVIPLHDDNPTTTKPYVTVGIMIACVLVYVAHHLLLSQGGAYRVQFVDCRDTPSLASQWWAGADDAAHATLVPVQPGSVAEGVDAVLQPETRALWKRFLEQGWIDVTRERHPGKRLYTFWVNLAAFERNAGFRMDFLMVTPDVYARVTRDGVDAEFRAREKPSDHAPTWIELD